MKLAVLLSGMSKMENYIHHKGNRKVTIDYEKSCENYEQYIFNYFKNIGYDIDVYFTTNMLDDQNKKKICEKYKPVKCNFMENKQKKIISKNEKLVDVLNLCLDSNITYDLILITRFDLLFQKKFGESNINFNKINIVSALKQPQLICDNFYLFPYRYLKEFSDIIKENLNNPLHLLQEPLYRKFGTETVNYILNENVRVGDLSFYKIVRNYDKA